MQISSTQIFVSSFFMIYNKEKKQKLQMMRKRSAKSLARYRCARDVAECAAFRLSSASLLAALRDFAELTLMLNARQKINFLPATSHKRRTLGEIIYFL